MAGDIVQGKITIIKAVALFIMLLSSGCFTSHKFRDDKTRILPKEKLTLDSVDILDPIIVGFDYPNLIEYPVVPNPLYRRPDSIRRILTGLTRDLLQKGNTSYKQLPHCEDKFFEVVRKYTWNHQIKGRQRKRFAIDSAAIENCLALPKAKTYLVFVFRLETYPEANGSSRIWDEILGSYLLVQNEEIKMYRQFRSHIQSKDIHFPRGSLDRANFPHFPQWQMEKVVKALVDDLKKRVELPAKPQLP